MNASEGNGLGPRVGEDDGVGRGVGDAAGVAVGSDVGEGADVSVAREVGVTDGGTAPLTHPARINKAMHATSPITVIVFIAFDMPL